LLLPLELESPFPATHPSNEILLLKRRVLLGKGKASRCDEHRGNQQQKLEPNPQGIQQLFQNMDFEIYLTTTKAGRRQQQSVILKF
jgi:hypothetical protein